MAIRERAPLVEARLDAVRRGTRLAAWLLAAALAAPPVLAQTGKQTGEPAATPEAAVERLHEALEQAAAEHGEKSLEKRYRALEPVVTATHDLPYIAQLTVRREWPQLTEDERRRFVDAFERLSIMTYAGRFRNLEEGMFELGGSEPLAGGRAHVGATLTTPGGDEIPFEYVLHETDGGWKIVNILADNVSDLALKRAEYRRLLADGSIEDVIAELDRQAGALAEE